MSSKHAVVLSVARDLFKQSPDWVTFFRVILGLDGVARQAFPTQPELEAFEASEEHDAIQAMLADLRQRTKHQPTDEEPTTVITVRLPKSVHESLKREAHEHRTSMNKLCVAKLLQPASVELPGSAEEEPGPAAASGAPDRAEPELAATT